MGNGAQDIQAKCQRGLSEEPRPDARRAAWTKPGALPAAFVVEASVSAPYLELTLRCGLAPATLDTDLLRAMATTGTTPTLTPD